MMKTIILTCVLAMVCFLVGNRASIAAERLPIAKIGDVIIMTAKNPDGRLCPVVACGQDAHTSRILTGTNLIVLQVYIEKEPMYDIPWYGVEHSGIKGWVSEYLTNRNPDGIGNNFCPRNPTGIFTGCDERQN